MLELIFFYVHLGIPFVTCIVLIGCEHVMWIDKTSGTSYLGTCCQVALTLHGSLFFTSKPAKTSLLLSPRCGDQRQIGL